MVSKQDIFSDWRKKLTLSGIILAVAATGVTNWRSVTYPWAPARESAIGAVCLAVLVIVLLV
jgi:hypothetical protein